MSPSSRIPPCTYLTPRNIMILACYGDEVNVRGHDHHSVRSGVVGSAFDDLDGQPPGGYTQLHVKRRGKRTYLPFLSHQVRHLPCPHQEGGPPLLADGWTARTSMADLVFSRALVSAIELGRGIYKPLPAHPDLHTPLVSFLHLPLPSFLPSLR